MALWFAFGLVVAVSGGALSAPDHVPASAVSAAQASARIMSAARIHLSDAAQPSGYVMKPARVTVEDGTRREAKLVEFQ